MGNSARYKVRDPDVVHETIDGETVIVNLSTGNYYSLQAVGADVWRLLAAGLTADQIVDGIDRRYKGERAEIDARIHELIDRLCAEQLIARDEGVASVAAEAADSAADAARPEFSAPVLEMHQDMQDLLLLDPIHDVDDSGWPNVDPERED